MIIRVFFSRATSKIFFTGVAPPDIYPDSADQRMAIMVPADRNTTNTPHFSPRMEADGSIKPCSGVYKLFLSFQQDENRVARPLPHLQSACPKEQTRCTNPVDMLEKLTDKVLESSGTRPVIIRGFSRPRRIGPPGRRKSKP